MNLSMIQSLYVFRNEEKIMLENEEYELYFAMLRLDFKDSPLATAILTDLFYYFYYEHLLVMNSEYELIYILRSALIKNIRRARKFERVKRNTINSYVKSLFAATMATNLLIDLIRMNEAKCTEEEYELISKYAGISNVLFPRNVSDYDDLPKQLIIIETKMMRYIEETFMTERPFIEKSIAEIVKFIDTLTINEKMLYGE